MKTKLFLPLLGIVLLLTAVSCTDPVEVNPNYNSETNEVMAKFVLNVSTQAPSTKQTAAATQATSDVAFRGVTKGFLMSKILAEDNTGAGTRGGIMVKDATMDKEYSIENAVAATTPIINGSARRVYEWSLPLKTDVALFYGCSPEGDIDANATYTKADFYGALESFSIGKENGSTDIQLKKRLVSKADLDAVETILSSMLTTLMAHQVKGNGNGVSFTIDEIFHFDGSLASYSAESADGHGYPSILWADYAKKNASTNDYMSPLIPTNFASPLEIKLASVYDAMMVVRSGELRAASGEAILRTVNDLWTTVKEVKNATATSYQEAMAKRFATLLDTRFEAYFTTTSTGSLPIAFRDIETVISRLDGDINPSAQATNPSYWPQEGISKKPSSFELPATTYRALEKFPFNFNLPRGAVHMKIYDSDDVKKVFYYPGQFDTSEMGTSGSYNAEDYYYPAPLIYFANSPLYTSNNEHSESEYPGGSTAKKWTDINSWSDWETGTNGYVKASTRSVALKHEVNYGVALLKTLVYYEMDDVYRKLESDGDGYYLYDNNHAIQKMNNPTLSDTDEPDKKIHVDKNSFELTGIIIGGQYINLDWDCLPYKRTTTYHGPSKQGFIYDKCIEDGTINGEASTYKPTYTVVFDTFNGTLGEDGMYSVPAASDDALRGQNSVSVALEFCNKTGEDFYGNYNVIRNNGYFYLIGSLNLSSVNPISSWPQNHIVPPYNSDGTSMEITRVFIQDFMTTAKFSIGKTSLHAAYLTVPDLRSSSLTLGLSVDTQWSTGLTFDSVILGE